jgi:sec-independent protein translocase protein TatB
MFDFGLSMSELLVIAVIALIVVGPKDLPKMLRTIGRFVTKLRGMAGEFQRHLDSAIREAGVEDMKKEVRNLTNFTATADIGKKVSEDLKAQGDEIKKMLDTPGAPPQTQPSDPEPAPQQPVAPVPAPISAAAPEETEAKAAS